MAATTFLPLLDERGNPIVLMDQVVPLVRNRKSGAIHLAEGRRAHCLPGLSVETAGDFASTHPALCCCVCRAAIRKLRPAWSRLANEIWGRLRHADLHPETADDFALLHFPNPWIEERPYDWPRLLVLADWWDEQGDPRGEALRVEAELAQGLAGTPRRFCQLLARRAELYDQIVGW